MADQSKASSFLEMGTEIAGSVAGTAIGLVVGGPLGALAGATSGPMVAQSLRRSVQEMMQRQMGPRQRARIAGVLLLAAHRIEEKVAGGLQLRQDGFWSAAPNGRASADEVIEGVLIAAENEYAERKIPYYANFLANLAFDIEVRSEYAHKLTRIAAQLSFRQMCLMAILSRKLFYNVRNSTFVDIGSEGAQETAGWKDWNTYVDEETMAMLQDIFDLYTQGLLNSSGHVLLDVTSIVPQGLNVQGAGSRLYRLMELVMLDESDLRPWVERLQ